MTTALEQAAITRMRSISSTSVEKRDALSQHLTPPETAKLAASMFSDLKREHTPVSCLDLGAGTGILSIALHERYGSFISRLDAVEADPSLLATLDRELSSAGIPHEIIQGDALVATPMRLYDRVILNPPYKKMGANDTRQSELPCRSANLYSAFIAVGLSHLADGGELVAIVPRSWMNGEYFDSFRRYALMFFSLDAIHVYGSRTEVFSDTNVLQETMIVRFSRKAQVQTITVTSSVGKSSEIQRSRFAASDLIDPYSLVVRVAPKESCGVTGTIQSEGLCPSTGKVVDFRNRDRIFKKNPGGNDVYPLLYACNFSGGQVCHPVDAGKPQWYRAEEGNERARVQLTRAGSYVVVKRFSSKEEKRRVVARPLVVDHDVALENHLNFIHSGTSRSITPLRSPELAKGLSIWLNSSFIDAWFRGVSGSTQVNAKDIKAMPCPPLDDLEKLGMRWCADMTQLKVDELCEVLRWTSKSL